MAAARDRRAAIQGELLRSHGVPLVCLSMNIAGEIKLYPLVRNAFYEGVRRIRESIAPLEEHVVCEFTGCEAFFCVAMDVKALKERMTKLEENDELGRLFDIDVLNAHGEKLSRGVMRRCLICSEAAAICARSRAHTLEELKARTDNNTEFFCKKSRSCGVRRPHTRGGNDAQARACRQKQQRRSPRHGYKHILCERTGAAALF